MSISKYVSSYHSQIGSPFKPIFYPIGSLVVHEFEVTSLSLSLSQHQSQQMKVSCPICMGLVTHFHTLHKPPICVILFIICINSHYEAWNQ
jgi:hypothetical protein